jgi:ribose transport system substrate-binding protein
MKGIFASLAVAFLAIAVLFFNLYGTVNNVAIENQADKKPKYHIQVITQNSDEHFWTMFKRGATAAGTDLNTYVEFVDVAQKDVDTSIQAVEKAIFSNVDGIAFQGQDINRTSAVLKAAKAKNIAALTFENELSYIPDVPTVGSNLYDIGQKEGSLGVEACKGKANAVLIVNGTGNQSSEYKNLKLQGIMDVFSKNPGISVKAVYSLSAGMFETEKLMSKILAQNPKVDLIVCTDERNTPSIAQTIVDNNRVGDISIVGYGAMPQTLKYIGGRGVIYGTVCPDAYNIGYDTVSQLFAILNGNQVSESLNTELFAINRANVDKFMVESNEK